MKKILALIFLLCVGRLEAQIINATVTITNAPTVNGQTITVNGNLRFFTNVVTSTANQILTNSIIAGVQSNLFAAYSVSPETSPRIQLSTSSTNIVNFISLPGQAMVVSVSSGWATVSFTTNALTNLMVLRVPPLGSAITAIGASERTNAENGIVGYLNDSAGTNIVTSNAPALIGYLTTNSPQTNWNKTEIAPALSSPTMTNGVNSGNAFTSPGSASRSEQFGTNAAATGANSVAVGYNAAASGIGALAFGSGASASTSDTTAIGANANASGNLAVAIGEHSAASGQNSIALGNTITAGGLNGIGIGSSQSGDNSIVIGAGSGDGGFANVIVIGNSLTAVAANLVLYGGNSQTNVFSGASSFVGNVVSNFNVTGNATFNATNKFTSPIAITAGANSSLVTGGNNIAAGTNGYLSLSGPLLAFTIYGISGGYEGLYLTLENDDALSVSMTLANESGLASAAANRIRTGYNADQTYTNSPGVVTLRYNGTLSRWVVQSSNK